MAAGASRVLLALALACHAGAARPEMCFGEYQAPARRATPAELKRHADELEQARRREAEALRQEAAAAEQRRREHAARRAARPPGERLLEARCTGCHDLDIVHTVRLGAPGWALTLLRMRLLNGAELPLAEARVLHRHLMDTQRAGAAAVLAEWAVVAFAFAVTGGALLRAGQRVRRRRGPVG